jgi:hypothetical protein
VGIFKRAGSGAGSHEYGLGWFIKPREKSYAFCKDQFFYASHTGGAIGASSVLLIGSLIYISFKARFKSADKREILLSSSKKSFKKGIEKN